MTRKDLITAISLKADVSEKTAGACLDAFMHTVVQTLKEGGNVKLAGFGTFQTRFHSAFDGKIAKLNQPGSFSERFIPKFKPSALFKCIVREAFEAKIERTTDV